MSQRSKCMLICMSIYGMYILCSVLLIFFSLIFMPGYCKHVDIKTNPVVYWKYENCECQSYREDQNSCDIYTKKYMLDTRRCTSDLCCLEIYNHNCEMIGVYECDINWYTSQEINVSIEIGRYSRENLGFGKQIFQTSYKRIEKYQCNINDPVCVQKHIEKNPYFCDKDLNKLKNQSFYYIFYDIIFYLLDLFVIQMIVILCGVIFAAKRTQYMREKTYKRMSKESQQTTVESKVIHINTKFPI
jgi:hypothetical protein